jgi:DNA-binding CsgD family transcriptional regulator
MDKIGDYLVDVMSVDSKRVVKIFCIVERFSNHDVYHNSFVSLTSKQTGISDFTSLLKRASLSFNNKHSNNYSELSLQELKILHCFIKGYSLKEISYKLNISVKTISAHKIKALSKLGVRRVSSKSVSYVSGYISSVLGNAYCIN